MFPDGVVDVSLHVGGTKHGVLSVHPGRVPPVPPLVQLRGSSQLEPHRAVQSADSEGQVSTSCGLQLPATGLSVTAAQRLVTSYNYVARPPSYIH